MSDRRPFDIDERTVSTYHISGFSSFECASLVSSSTSCATSSVLFSSAGAVTRYSIFSSSPYETPMHSPRGASTIPDSTPTRAHSPVDVHEFWSLDDDSSVSSTFVSSFKRPQHHCDSPDACFTFSSTCYFDDFHYSRGRGGDDLTCDGCVEPHPGMSTSSSLQSADSATGDRRNEQLTHTDVAATAAHLQTATTSSASVASSAPSSLA
jgi:hypothetical protein